MDAFLPFQTNFACTHTKKECFSLSFLNSAEIFYASMQNYVLSEEQLRENGYPLPVPSSPGEATIERSDRYRSPKIEPVGPNGTLQDLNFVSIYQECTCYIMYVHVLVEKYNGNTLKP